MSRQSVISYRLAQRSILCAVLLGVVTSAFEIWFDYREENKRIAGLTRQMLLAASPSASEAALRLDKNLAVQVVTGISSFEFAGSALLVDDLGKRLAEFGTADFPIADDGTPGASADRQRVYGTELFSSKDDQQVGHLYLSVNRRVALADFVDRITLHIVTGLMVSVLLAALLFWIFHRQVARPLVALSRGIGDVDSRAPGTLAVIDDRHKTDDDEIWALQAATNQLLAASRDNLDELNTTHQHLQQSERRMSDFASAGSDWFWETDGKGALVYLSKGYFKLTGWPVWNELSNVNQSFEEEENYQFPGYVRQLGISGVQMSFRDISLEVPLADGGVAQIRCSGVPWFDEQGHFAGYRGIASDQSAFERSERERERLSKELSHGQKLSAIGQLTGGIAHDFSNLLAIIIGSVELMQDEDASPEDQRQLLGSILDAGERGAALTHRLLAYSRQQPLAPERLQPDQVLVSLEDMLQRSLGALVELDIVVSDGVWPCQADRHELETVLLNLAINARDAMPEGGRLTIEASNALFNLEEVSATGDADADAESGQYVRFTVIDNGIGMNQQTLARAVDPYFSTKAAGEGTGLGLSMAFGFAKQSNGHLKIYSEEGLGTTIKLYLPRADAGVLPSPTVASAEPNRDLPDHCHVLVVEDDHVVRKTVVLQLEAIGCRATAASDAEDALLKSSTHAGFDVLLMDIVLSGSMQGLELAHILLNRHPEAVVVFISGYTENALNLPGAGVAGAELLQKPFTGSQLKHTLLRALSRLQRPEAGQR